MSDVISAVNVFYFLTYLILATLVCGRLIWRVYLYRAAKEPIPLLLKRDVPLFVVLVSEFGLVMLGRAFGIHLQDNLLWVVLSGGAAVGALGFWVYVEYFRIGD